MSRQSSGSFWVVGIHLSFTKKDALPLSAAKSCLEKTSTFLSVYCNCGGQPLRRDKNLDHLVDEPQLLSLQASSTVCTIGTCRCTTTAMSNSQQPPKSLASLQPRASMVTLSSPLVLNLIHVDLLHHEFALQLVSTCADPRCVPHLTWLRPFQNEDPCGLISVVSHPCKFLPAAGYALPYRL